MMRHMCKSKIHRATITEANLDYVGSITISQDLLEAADLMPYEKVQIVDINNGSRLETYVIPAEPGTGQICINGAAARLVHAGDLVIIISYAMLDSEELRTFRPKVVFVDEKNKIKEIVNVEPPFKTHLQVLTEVC